jgi:hypothetical protein
VSVEAIWIMPARIGRLIVPAGRIAVYEPRIGEENYPEDVAEGEEWYPTCRHCGEPLFDPGSVPGMQYPEPDLPSPWCPNNERTDRPRPHAATWQRVNPYL